MKELMNKQLNLQDENPFKEPTPLDPIPEPMPEPNPEPAPNPEPSPEPQPFPMPPEPIPEYPPDVIFQRLANVTCKKSFRLKKDFLFIGYLKNK